MRVLFAASECAPLVKIGGLGDVVGSLPKALKNEGVEVSVVLPYYQPLRKAFEEKRFPEPQKIAELSVSYKDQPNIVAVWQTQLPSAKKQILVFLLDNFEFIGKGGVYFSAGAFAQDQKEINRFSFFSEAIVQLIKKKIVNPDIVHCHDYHTALVSLLLKNRGLNHPAVLLTIHNLFNQGISDLSIIEDLALDKGVSLPALGWDAQNCDINLLMQGIIHADVINTVSPGYAEEIKTADFGEGLQEIIKGREARIYGVLNGIDEDYWSTEDDRYLYRTYDMESYSVKKPVNKNQLIKELKLEVSERQPLLTFIGRLVEQKGIDLILEGIQKLIEFDAGLIFLGVGDEAFHKPLRNLARSYPQKIAVKLEFNEALAHKIYAGADVILIPSRFEPCGLIQMIAMRYGTIPVARAVGGLKDTIKDGKTGFLFKEYSTKAMLAAINRALECYSSQDYLLQGPSLLRERALRDDPWSKMIRAAMSQDFSWDRSAQEYVKLYKKAIYYKRLELKKF